MLLLVARSFFLLLLFALAPFTYGATLYIDPGLTTLYRGDGVTMAVRLMPDMESSECINVVDAVITYPPSIQPVDVSIGKSIFNVWVEPPKINKEERTITLAGGIPNGYCGRVQGDPRLTNIIAEIVFRSPGLQIGAVEGGDEAVIGFGPETQAYLNDGQGTKANLVTYGSTITLEKIAAPSGITDTWRSDVQGDSEAPEKFSISLEKDEAGINFNGQYFIVFSTTDKQTGISHYEIMEEPISEFKHFTWGGVDAPWIEGVSPYTLKDQSLNSIIRVKAFDKAGNEYIATLIPDESMKTISQQQMIGFATLGLAIFLLTLAIIFGLIYYRKRRRLIKEDLDNIGETNL